MSRALFWSGVGSLAYVLVGFPAIVLFRWIVAGRPVHRAPITPRVSIIVSARNEALSIGAKLDSLLALAYPGNLVEIVVASDGSDDGTDEIVRGYEDRGVRLLALPRVGKAAALNQAVATSSGEIIVFSDANSLFAPTALSELVAPFADPEVGGVAGDQRYLPDDSAPGERGYWDLDRMIKRLESGAGHVISATGAIYAIRRDLFEPVPDGVTDDFVISTGVVQRGRRLVFAPSAIAYEPIAATNDVEFGRKVRIMTRGFRAVIARKALLNPARYGFYSVQLLSHKVLRRLMAIPLAAVALGTIGSLNQGAIYRLAGIAQLTFYGSASVGMLASGRRFAKHPLFALPAFFCMVSWGGVVAAANVLRGHRIDRWEPAREPSAPSSEATWQR